MAIKRVDLRRINFKPGSELTLALDVYNDSGVLIAPTGTKVGRDIRELILRNGKTVIAILIPDNQKDSAPEEIEEQVMSIHPEKTEEFLAYKEDYEEMKKEVTETLEAVQNNKPINVDKAVEATKALIGNLKTKSEAFLYMNFMRDFDSRLGIHSNHVAMLSNIFGQWLGLDKNELATLTAAGALHDVGKIDLPKSILDNPGMLTPKEKHTVRAHATKGYIMLKKYDLPKEVVNAAYSHHERIDGTGYPRGLTGDKIDFMSKIITIVDKFDTLTSYRPYSEQQCPFDVIHSFETGQMYGILDTELLLIFLRNIAENYVGSWAMLSNGKKVKVTFIHKTSMSKPIVQTEDGEFIDLSEQRDIKIVALV